MARGYVGRERECAEFDHALEALLLGQGGLLLVTGEPGIGKTRFLEEGALRAREAGCGMAWATCWQGAEARSLGVWSQLLDQLGGEKSVEAEPSDDPEHSRRRRYDLFVEQLRRRAERQPLLLVVDDLPWADEPSVRLLRHGLGSMHTMPVLVAASARTPLPAALDGLARKSRTIPLSGLDPTQTEALVREAVGVATTSDDLGVIHEHTRGNPLFVRELALLLVSAGRLVSPGELVDTPLPESVRSVLHERLTDLSPDARDLLGMVAVAGEEAGAELLAEVTRSGIDSLDGPIEAARTAGLVEHGPGGRLVLTHPLLRAVLYDELGVARRVRLHADLGRALAKARGRGVPIPEAALAEHFLRGAPGGTVAEAVAHARVAAEDAIQMAAYEEAVRLLDRARTALDISPMAADRVDLLLDLGHARWAAGDHVGARSAHLEAASLARPRERADQLARAALGLAGRGGFEVPLFDHEQVDLLEEALAILPESEPELRAWCAARLSVALALTGADLRRASLAEDGVALARRSGSDAALAQALAARCDAAAGPATCEERLADSGEIVELGRRSGDRSVELLGRRHRIVALLELGDLVAADAEIETFARMAAALAQPRFEWYVALWRAARALHDRRVEDFERFHAEAAVLGGLSGSPNAGILLLAQRYFGMAELGRRTEAAAFFDEGTTGQSFAELGVQMAVTVAWNNVLADRVDRARIVLDGVLDRLTQAPRDSEWVPMLVQAAEVGDAVGGHPAAEWARAQLMPFADRWVIEGIGAVIRGPVGELLDSTSSGGGGNGWRREGDVWTVTFHGTTIRMRHSKGMSDLARLLDRPGRELAALDLMEAGVVEPDTGDRIDAAARSAYRRRIEEIESELDSADRSQDAGGSERLTAEREAILSELTAAYGLGGRARAGGTAERARTAVTARIRETIKRITEADPELGRHLGRSVRTGTFCCYDPDPPEVWTS